MRKLIIAFLIVLFIFSLNSHNYLHAQNKYLVPKENQKSFLKSQYVPIAIIGVGSVLTIGDIKKNIQKAFPNTNISIDDYIPFIPVAELYISDITGVEHLNTVYNQTKYYYQFLQCRFYVHLIIVLMILKLVLQRLNYQK